MDKTESHDNSNVEEDRSQCFEKSQPSLASLIIWNISKALEKNPDIDLRCAMRLTHQRLERQSRDVSDFIPQAPEERNITCAVLAWQQLGHNDTEGLYEFIESHRNKASRITSENSSKKGNICSVNSTDVSKRPKGFIDHKPSMYRRGVDSASFDTSSLIGPVLKLPVETKVVMRVENTSPCTRHAAKKSPKSQKNDITNKIDAACCLDSACVERLKELETSIGELRARAGKLAKREAERVELLERAEAAWRDLELGYQRRLLHAEEKEDDIAKQIKKCIEDRNAYKQACTALAQQLNKRGDIVEKDRAQLTQVEKEVCDLACTRLRLSEESAKGDSAVADQQCKVVQLERDLQFREEQARRKLLSIESVADSTRGLSLEAERAMREELSTIKDQISQVSNQLLEVDAENNKIKAELDDLRQQKTDLFEDIEGCKQMCDNRMQSRVDELNKKRQMLKELKDKVIECQCKLPLDAAVEVKRTPSLAALCCCTAEEKILHCCSCTSVRSTLLSNLLADLFEGLQAELGDTSSLMPCQLLKCLEDKHNWDRASIVKSNLRSFFSQLLVGELDTAIATSIEKYHATWVGASCADKAKLTPEPGEVESEGWQERALESRAQKMATQLAEQLFEERADQLVQRAKDIMTSGPPPCECKPQSNKATAYPCLIKTHTIGSRVKRNETTYQTYPSLKKTLQDVSVLRTQIDDLKKESIKKEDLKMMEEKIAKIVQQVTEPENATVIPNFMNPEDKVLQQKTIHRSVNTEKLTTPTTKKSVKKNITDGVIKKSFKKSNSSNIKGSKVIGKSFRKEEQSYAVNLCLCDGKNNTDFKLINHIYSDNMNYLEEKTSQGILSKIHSNKPMDKIHLQDSQNSKTKKKCLKAACSRNCKCFHKKPSNSSINKLLEKLLKWQGDLSNDSAFNSLPQKVHRSIESNMNEIHHNSELSNNKKSVNISQDRESKNNNVNKIDVLMTTENNQAPPITTSEYIGEINLDKSYDHICKYDNLNHVHDSNIHTKLLFKCLNRTNSDCEKLMQNNIDIYKDTELNKNRVITIDNNESNFKAKPNVIEVNSGTMVLINKPPINKTDASFSTKNKETTEKNYLSKDMYVKFLGVTLTDINEENLKIERQKANKANKTKAIESQKQLNLLYNLTTSDKNNSTSYKEKQPCEIKSPYNKTKYRSNINHCQFVERQNSSNESRRCDENEFKDDQYFEKAFQDTNSCVCCHDDEETKNLELNTFYLLEKHLKHKLAGLKKSSCDSSYILPNDEEKIFSNILKKVKQVISGCTHNLKCECSIRNSNSSSWIRVNNLLEEYLKIKIKRVQCTCFPNEESLDTVLSYILKQVNDLIENDFKRLRSMCKCNDSNILECNQTFNDDCENSLKESNKKAIDIVKPIGLCINRENVSTQGSLNLKIQNKSCDAVEVKETKDIQTSHTNILSCLNPNEVIITHCYNLHDELPLKSSFFDNNTPAKSEYTAKESLHIIQVNASNASLLNKELNSQLHLPIPYIGLTLSCSCDNNLGSCFCSKSLNQAHIKNMENIWKMLEINKKLLPNLSYIMHSIPKRITSENTVNFVEVSEPFISTLPEKRSLHSVEIGSADVDAEITLKNSDDKVQRNDIYDNMTSTIDDFISVTTEYLNDDDALYWYDCCAVPRNRNESLQNKSFYDSVYSPVDKLHKGGKSDISVKNNVTMCISKSKNCDCVMVPVCHVKMLIESIESKLVNTQCTCDSFISQICPLHSKTEHN